jgi:hypothetical protein
MDVPEIRRLPLSPTPTQAVRGREQACAREIVCASSPIPGPSDSSPAGRAEMSEQGDRWDLSYGT